MVRKIIPISLNEYVDLVRPRNGLVIYKDTLAVTMGTYSDISGATNGNEITDLRIVERDVTYNLAKIGIPTITLDGKVISRGYVSPYAVLAKNPESKFLEAKLQDEKFVQSVVEDGTGLWLAGCFCCIDKGVLASRVKHSEKGKLGILVSRDNIHLTNGLIDRTYPFSENPEFIDHFTYVAPYLNA
ncbi:hypothetical protein GOV12_00915 [Candidatus Pacearchaeota archaeon]|nr:hypothetical protein [Candidatus Pacearchaeota archaeon]